MQGKNKQLLRVIEKAIAMTLKRGDSVLLLGPRQTGKTTLSNKLLDRLPRKTEYYLQDPTMRLELEADPGKIIRQVEAISGHVTVFVDEAQKIPELFDAAQYLIDKKKANFILTGSSARKLRRKGVNLLPGRINRFYLDPLSWAELGFIKENIIRPLRMENINKKANYSIEETMVYGSLPGIVIAKESERANRLRSYSEIYLEEEIRAEALSRKIGSFSKFLELAAAESGTSPNFTKLSNESGVSSPAIKEFYQILEDTLVVERIEPFLRNARKRILSSPRYYFFDLGVRNALARLPLSKNLVNAQKGILFEHAVILELTRRIRSLGKNYKIYYWRTSGGAEVDCVLDLGKEIIPIEIKYSKNVSSSDLKGLEIFLKDYRKLVRQAYVVTLDGRKEKIANKIIRIPWDEL
ncbi:ATP-binding protein [Patescibacteria group bacterium]|nr:ATP-binding protein [Patescibacteria group bacterium]MBU4347771.1 ATP-binding protein [Patescibacteria group bacterium]MBU4454958.1 ATP-binding protein [Patescibacteria group bacterium]MCG2690841.1 ATP-binding protein [Candidatus Parcubacteria bacterium]MDP3043608.1 ATP-binding protein [bacterium]